MKQSARAEVRPKQLHLGLTCLLLSSTACPDSPATSLGSVSPDTSGMIQCESDSAAETSPDRVYAMQLLWWTGWQSGAESAFT